MTKKQAVLSLSGGMDSSTVLLHLLAEGYEVTALSFDYGQKHNVELERAAELIEYLDKNGYEQTSRIFKIKSFKKINWNDLLNNNRALVIKEKLKSMRN